MYLHQILDPSIIMIVLLNVEVSVATEDISLRWNCMYTCILKHLKIDGICHFLPSFFLLYIRYLVVQESMYCFNLQPDFLLHSNTKINKSCHFATKFFAIDVL